MHSTRSTCPPHLSNVYCLAACRQNSAAPSAPHPIPYRALLKQPNAPCMGEMSSTLPRPRVQVQVFIGNQEKLDGAWEWTI